MKRDKEKQSVFEKVKQTGVKKITRLVVVVFFIFALVFATITNLGFRQFDVAKFFANSLIMCGILVFGLVMGESGGVDYYRGLEEGIYKRNVKEYNEFNEKIKPHINNFDAWYTEALPKELENKKVNFLVKNGLKIVTAKRIVKYCTIADINALANESAIKKHDSELDKDIYIEQIEKYQVEAVTWVLDGHIRLNSPNAVYFTTLYNDTLDDITLLEQGNAIVKTRKKVRNLNRATRIATSVVFSALWASLTVYELMSGDSLESWMNLISRISGLFTAIFSGYVSAKVMVNLDARQIKNKYEVLLRFSNDILTNAFIVKDEQQILKDKYEKEQAKKQEAVNNVIDPEVITTPQLENKLHTLTKKDV